ncbi:MAG TPA: tryptophan--tRNA ligase [Conexivisphaerales archaeon]|nr:tryptophan--tRNA ligase [Conexivisphaerales archaeon]
MSGPELDPWGISDIKDYGRLYEEFGISPLPPELAEALKKNRYVRRKLIFGQRDLQSITDAASSGRPYAVMSGIKPTGPFHLGSKVTAEEIIFFQSISKSATAFYSIADVEAYCDNGMTMAESSAMAVINVADLLALGLDPSRAVVYKQSDALAVQDLAFVFSRDVTFNTLKAIYGERPIGLYLSAFVQAGDILLPETKLFGGPKPVLVPVGADQDPHIRLTRDIAQKHSSDMGMIPPSSIYHKLVRSLKGDTKMSKRDPMTMLTLSDTPKEAKKKILAAFTGGRSTVEEQRKLGANPNVCPVFDLYLYHFVDDDGVVKTVYDECTTGARLCGECKLQAAGYVEEFLKKHQEKRERMLADAEDLLERGRPLVGRKPI